MTQTTARMQAHNAVLLDVASASTPKVLPSYEQHEMSTIFWAFAKLKVKNYPLMDAIAEKAIASRAEIFNPQGLANMAWSCAVIQYCVEPLLNSIAAEAIMRICQFTEQNIANTAWAFAKMLVKDSPFFAAISSASQARIAQFFPQALANMSW